MKKVITLCVLTFFACALNAQTLNGTQDFTEICGGTTCYTLINWSVNYQIYEEDGMFKISLSNPKVSVANNSLYGSYSKSDLGLSSWPNPDKTPYNFSLILTIKSPDGSNISCYPNLDRGSYIDKKDQFKNTTATASSFKVVSVESMHYNGGSDNAIDKLIESKKSNQNKNTNNSQNPITPPETSSSINQSQGNSAPASETKANPVQIPEGYKGNPMTYNTNNASNDKTVEAIDNFNKGYQQGQQIGNVVTGIADLFTPTPEQLQKKAEAQRLAEEKNATINKNCKTYLEGQMALYFPAAQKGDEKARMKLCQEFLSIAYTPCADLKYLLPDEKKWLKEAAANKNFYAINSIGIASVFNGPYGFPIFGLTVDQGIAMMDESVNMGNTDAMLLLGIYYSRKKKSPFFGGANALKSIYYFEKGAKMGNVDCLYSLGMIYRHNYVNEATNIKFKIEKDDIAAFNYFSTAIISRYNEDSEIIKPHRQSVTYCIVCSDILKKSYYELSVMYEGGIGCDIDKEIAKKLREEYEKK